MTTPEAILARIDALRVDLEQLIAEHRDALACLTPPEPDRPICEYATVAIRGTVYVDVAPNEDGTWTVVHNTTDMLRFTPDAGTPCDIEGTVEIADAARLTGDYDALGKELCVLDVEGPFWRAMQRHLASQRGACIDWCE